MTKVRLHLRMHFLQCALHNTIATAKVAILEARLVLLKSEMVLTNGNGTFVTGSRPSVNRIACDVPTHYAI